MQIDPSPFLHREERQQQGPRYRIPGRQERDGDDKVKAAYLLESLRYRWYEKRGDTAKRLSFHLMQPLGDFGRKTAWVGAALTMAYLAWLVW